LGVGNVVRRACTVTILAGFTMLACTPRAALASHAQLAMFEDDATLQAHPQAALQAFKQLGAGIVRVYVKWSAIAPDPTSTTPDSTFDAADPAAYPAQNWTTYDTIVRDAKALGLQLDFTVSGGAPLWAQSTGIPDGFGTPVFAWKPSAAAYGQFVQALGTRYSGSYVPPGQSAPLPRVSFWALWNEPNVGKDLGPQATNGSSLLTAPAMYRGLLDAGWSALQATRHGLDTILIGSLAARGQAAPVGPGRPDGLPGNYGMTKPLAFLRSLYCLDSRYQPLTGAAASASGCPASPASFRAAHPGLFAASGFADHPYPVNLPPTRATANDRDFTEFSQLPNLEKVLDRVQRTYSSTKRFPIYITEYGYVTNPPNNSQPFVSPATAAVYLNWAEYLSWRDPRIATTMQYLLRDPNPRVGVPEFGGFATGLRFFGGTPKPTLAAYRMPLFLPSTSATARQRTLEVWGCVRPAHYAALATHRAQTALIQFRRGSRGGFATIKRVPITDPRGYFDVRVAFPASGAVRIAWSDRGINTSRVVPVVVR